MGQPKLLLPFRDGLLIDRVLRAWTSSPVDETVVVVRSSDTDLKQACEAWPVHVVSARHDPPDMKASVLIGRQFIAETLAPEPIDHCFVAPADLPGLTPDLIGRLVALRTLSSVVVPVFGERDGHPILLPWTWTEEISHLRPDHGINQLINRKPRTALRLPHSDRIVDMDTPDDYRSACRADEDAGEAKFSD